MVVDGVLPPRDVIGWHEAVGESFPTTEPEEIVLFESFLYRGFSLPTCNFFHALLHFYGIELIHLNLNSILHITTFIHLHEAYLSIHPHFNLFCHFFTLKPYLFEMGDPVCTSGFISILL